MPTLGFLKKKKTKEHDLHDSSSPIENHAGHTTTAARSGSLVSASANTVSSANSSEKAGDTMMQNHGPTPTSAPQETLASRPHTGTDPTQTDGAALSRAEPHHNGSENAVLPSNHQPAVPRSTKGKYQLTDFTMKRTLGTGSFGRVHLVQSNHNQRFYAVKVLKKAQVVKMKQVEHTNDERRMLQKVKHAFLVTLWGTFQDARNLYMVMDFIEGGELFSLLRKSQVSPLEP